MAITGLKNYLTAAAADGKISPREMETARYIAKNNDGQIDAEELGALVALKSDPGVVLESGADVFIRSDQPKYVASKTTFGGTEVPPAVRALLAKAKLDGAAVYAADNPKFNTYGVTAGAKDAKGVMGFRYTEITPESLAADKAIDQPLTQIDVKGTANPEEDTVDYIQSTGGRGLVTENYDHGDHDANLYARGSEGQKWSANFAVLEDGSLHCLPATRRLPGEGTILTNPDLGRGKKVMFTGHLDVNDGKVTGVEMSGVISKLAGKGSAKFIDPVALIKAWGIDIADGVTTSFSNTSKGTPRIDSATGLIVKP